MNGVVKVGLVLTIPSIFIAYWAEQYTMITPVFPSWVLIIEGVAIGIGLCGAVIGLLGGITA